MKSATPRRITKRALTLVPISVSLMMLFGILVGVDADVETTIATSPAISPTQRRYYQEYGIPNQSIVFEAPPPASRRRIETWFYPHRGFRLTFDNGYFAKRETIPKCKYGFLGRSLLPTDFNATLTPGTLRSLFGEPTKVVNFDLPNHRMIMYAYNNPRIPSHRLVPTDTPQTSVTKSFAVTFVDNKFVSAVVGTDLKLAAATGDSPGLRKQ